MGSPLTVFGDQKTFAWNPWRATSFANETYYFRNPVPWDKRRQHLTALSAPQREAASAFIDAAKHESEPERCRNKTGMARNVCRVKEIGNKLRGKNHGGTPYEQRLQQQRETAEELSSTKQALRSRDHAVPTG